IVAFFSARPTYPILMVSSSALASAAVRRKTSAAVMIARIKAPLDVFASVILSNIYCSNAWPGLSLSEIRTAMPQSQRGPAFRLSLSSGRPNGSGLSLPLGRPDGRLRPDPAAQCGLRLLPLETVDTYAHIIEKI